MTQMKHVKAVKATMPETAHDPEIVNQAPAHRFVDAGLPRQVPNAPHEGSRLLEAGVLTDAKRPRIDGPPGGARPSLRLRRLQETHGEGPERGHRVRVPGRRR